MRTYLVTGGAGFIGSNYIHYMFKKYDNEIRIINVDKLTYAGNLENLKDIEDRENYTFVKADICDSEAIMKIFDENDIDRVVHFAAESHVDRSIRNPEVFVKTNVLGTLVMLNAAKSAWELPDGTFKPDKKFLHVSTDEVYGSLEENGGFFYETTPYDPHSPYSASKASSDMLVKSYMDTYKFPANITNCSNNYGPYQFPEKLIPLIINNALQGKKLPVYGEGFVALLYAAYNLVRIEFVLEISWMNSLEDYIKPFEISIKKEQNDSIKKITEELAKKSGSNEEHKDGQPLMLMNSAMNVQPTGF